MINPNYVTTVTGRLVYDPDFKTTDKGTSICRITIAVDTPKAETEFVPCEIWRQTADFVSSYFTKGKWISVVGTFKTDKYKGKDGQQKQRQVLVVENAGFCGAKDDMPARNDDGTLDIKVEEEELPF